ncbi:MAG: hypothetical protein HQL32_07405 [Planctomycetes bacterium]|nr:hypothetical protein [Planctomycetota bacterium]
MNKYSSAIIMLAASSITAEEVSIAFPEQSYSIRDVIERIEEETPYVITLAFADHANMRKSLASSYKLTDILHWISRYFDEHNNQMITYTIKGHKIVFQETSSLDTKGKERILNQKLRLAGRDMTIGEAMEVAESQIAQRIVMPMEDRAALKADYNYECSLEEFIDEIRRYYKERNHQYLSYGISQNVILFHQAGRTSHRQLRFELLDDLKKPSFSEEPQKTAPKKQVVKTRKAIPAEPLAFTYPGKEERKSIKAQKPIPQKSPIKKKLKKEKPSLFPARFDKVERASLLTFLAPKNTHNFVRAIIRPHNREASFEKLIERVSPYLTPSKGYELWQHNVLSLDLNHPLSEYQVNQYIKRLEESWLHQVRKRNIKVTEKSVKKRNWSFYLDSELGVGNGVTRVGDHPAKKGLNEQAEWLKAEVGTEYTYRPIGPWSFHYGAFVDKTIAKGDIGDALQQGSIGLSMKGNRLVGQSSIRAISPYAQYIYESDFMSGSSLQAHSLAVIGSQFHWKDGQSFLGFEKTLADTDLFLSINQCDDHESLDIPDQNNRDRVSLGLLHNYALVSSLSQGYQGPNMQAGLIHRNSDSDYEQGLEFRFQLGYNIKWNSLLWQNSISYMHWGRSDSIKELSAASQIEASPWNDNQVYYGKLAYEDSSSDDKLADYTNSNISIGVTFKW